MLVRREKVSRIFVDLESEIDSRGLLLLLESSERVKKVGRFLILDVRDCLRVYGLGLVKKFEDEVVFVREGRVLRGLKAIPAFLRLLI